MKKFVLVVFITTCCLPTISQSVKGIVKDAVSQEPLGSATIVIEKHETVFTDGEGRYHILGLTPGNYKLIISHVGYQSAIEAVTIAAGQTRELNILLSPAEGIGNEIVVSASKRAEKITHAPASIHVITEKDLQRLAGSNIGELFATIQGLEYTRSGVDQMTFNARGFHSAFNNKVMQLVDGRISMAALSGGLALFNNGTANKDDIDRIEIILGPQTALYGPNAHNALINYITKDPRKYGGTTFSSTIGNQSQFSMRLRQAAKVNEKWAYKFSGEYARGKEFEIYDSVYAGGGVFGPPVAIPERNINFNFKHLRGEGSVYYSLNKKSDIILSGGTSTNDFFQVTTATHNQMQGVSASYLQLKLVNPRLYATIYNTWGGSGNSYPISSYTQIFWNRTHSTLPRTDSIRGRLTETEAEGVARTAVSFKENSRRLNGEVQYNYHFEKQQIFVVAGATYQQEDPNGYGINLVDKHERIRITQYGAVLQVEKKLPYNFRISAASRYDYHNVFGDFVSPRVSITKNVKGGTVRLGYGKAYAMPSILNQFAKINNVLFGNGKGITYIPEGTKMQDELIHRAVTSPLLPEEVNAWEVGYKASFEKLFIDIAAYRSLSKNFLSPPRSVAGRVLLVGDIPVIHNPLFAGTIVNDTLKNAVFTTFFNYGDVLAYGIDGGIEYRFSEMVSAAIKYSWFGSDITDKKPANDANKDGVVSAEETALNAPRHRGNASLMFSNLLKRKAFFKITARYLEQYDFYSGNQIGTAAGKGKRGVVNRDPLPPIYKNFDWGPLGGFTSIDLQASYQFNKNLQLNAGISNLFNSRQIEFIASPSIGRLISLELKIHIPD